MLLGLSFAVQEGTVDWEWLGVDSKEWSPQQLDWEVYRVEHLAFAQKLETTMCLHYR